jgi:hypothetical protein
MQKNAQGGLVFRAAMRPSGVNHSWHCAIGAAGFAPSPNGKASGRCPGLCRFTRGMDQPADAAAFFLRQPNRPSAPRPLANSGSAAGMGTVEGCRLPMPALVRTVYPAGAEK